MAVLYHIWVPAFALAHVLGVSLLLYSLEKVSGIVSKSCKRVHSRVQSVFKRKPKFDIETDGGEDGAGGSPLKLVAMSQRTSSARSTPVRVVATAARLGTCRKGL